MKESHILEGYGPLDVFLARQRYRLANRKTGPGGRDRRILDIGCGSYPLFLTMADFGHRYGLDKNIGSEAVERMGERGIILTSHLIEQEDELPFEEDFFDAVTMLAVFEHIEPAELVRIHREIRRILKPGGIYVMTTPAWWTDGLLRLMARLRLISDVSIREHKDSYSHRRISSVLTEAGFEKAKLRFGYFELFMNSWATAAK